MITVTQKYLLIVLSYTAEVSALSKFAMCNGDSLDGTTIPPATSITDRLNNTWTLSNGYIYKNGNQEVDTPNTNLVLWYGGIVYRQDTGGQFTVSSFLFGKWLNCTDPRIPKAANPGAFYGMNYHRWYPDNFKDPPTLVALLKKMGINAVRTYMGNFPKEINDSIGLAKVFQPAGLTLFPVLDYPLHKDWSEYGPLYDSEDAAYDFMKRNAAAVATALLPYGINITFLTSVYECGNELTWDEAIFWNRTRAGNEPGDYNNTNWPILRGVIRGEIDGIKSIQPNARVGVNFITAHIAAAEMLWEGVQPDGSTMYPNGTAYPKVRWEVTTWHEYPPYQNIFDVWPDPTFYTKYPNSFNLPAYVKARYGGTFQLNEWNGDPHWSVAKRAKYAGVVLDEIYSLRKLHAIESTSLYEIMIEMSGGGDDPGFGVVSANGTPTQPLFNEFQSFIASHPDI